MRLIVFTDLDGSLLDHNSYSYDAAKPALDLLRNRDVPLILASSKTAAEIAPLRAELGFVHCPAIVENGAGLLPAHMSLNAFSGEVSEYQRIRAALKQLPSGLQGLFVGFGDWSDREIATQTGLDLKKVILASKRFYSEPGLWRGDDGQRQEFETWLEKKGIKARQGGRYYTLSFGATKADQMRNIIDDLGWRDRPVLTIALGDAPNDIEMLEAADRAVIIKNPHGPTLPALSGEEAYPDHIIRTQKSGPQGWNEAIQKLFGQIYSNDAHRQTQNPKSQGD
ncbi:HAD-IIB family hydrolase [Cohaesibacter celericrescens]|uniref:HAD-IIB family hydrolase n=1 Tax=Cohaesibacter celericrescens TaxID=2067669 RepID=UPI003563C3E2